MPTPASFWALIWQAFDIVRDCMHNETVRGFMNKMLHEEIIPTLPLDKKDLEEFLLPLLRIASTTPSSTTS